MDVDVKALVLSHSSFSVLLTIQCSPNVRIYKASLFQAVKADISTFLFFHFFTFFFFILKIPAQRPLFALMNFVSIVDWHQVKQVLQCDITT